MRITAKTVPAGETFMTRFPEWDHKIEDVSTNGELDEAKVRQALKGWQEAGFLMWGDDSRGVLAFTIEFLNQLATVTRNVEADEKTDAHVGAETEADRRLERRYERGRFSYTRFDITGSRAGIRVRVSCANPKDIPGTAISSARRFAVYACRILAYIKGEIEKANQKAFITLEGVGDLEDIFDEAAWTDRKMEERDKVDEANAKRMTCANRVGDYCSPFCPACRCCVGGKCVAAELPEEYRHYSKH